IHQKLQVLCLVPPKPELFLENGSEQLERVLWQAIPPSAGDRSLRFRLQQKSSSGRLRLANRCRTNRLLVERCQVRAVIGDVHSEQGRRLFFARILTDEMATSGRLKKAFTRLVDFDRSGRGIFGTDRPREYISDDASGVMM